MEPVVVAVVGIAAIVLALVAIVVVRRRQLATHSAHLRHKFGPEYQRALVEHHGAREVAERELESREHRVSRLEVRSLDLDEYEEFIELWALIQRQFVDDPRRAVDRAAALLEELMRARGYPTLSFDDEVALLSVDHPDSVQHYRAARSLAEERRGGEGTTEEIRQAMIHYRALFNDLLAVDAGEPAVDRDRAPEPQEATR